MKKTAAIISACMLTFALSACSGSNYVMHTNDGRPSASVAKAILDELLEANKAYWPELR